MYKVKFNNIDIELPKCTLSTQEQIDDILTTYKLVQFRQEKFKNLAIKMHSFLVELIGEKKVQEALECSNLYDVDVRNLELLVVKIIDAFNEKMEELNISKINNAKEMIKGTSDTAKILESMDKMGIKLF